MVRTAYLSDGVTKTNISLPRKQENQHTPYSAPNVPQGPSPLLPPLDTLDASLRRLIITARNIFEKRPINTRRVLFNCLPAEDLAIIGVNPRKHIQQYVGYVFIGGPWSKAIIRFGVDPRKDNQYRIYQTLTFQLDEPSQKQANENETGTTQTDQPDSAHDAQSHIFDGTKVHTDGKVWQICDLTDPILVRVLSTDHLRPECHLEYDGWFYNATLGKARTILRHKFTKLQKGEEIDESVFEKMMILPDIYGLANAKKFTIKRWDKEGWTKEEARLIDMVRAMATRTIDRSLPAEAQGGQWEGSGAKEPAVDRDGVEARGREEASGQPGPPGVVDERDDEGTAIDSMLLDEEPDIVPDDASGSGVDHTDNGSN